MVKQAAIGRLLRRAACLPLGRMRVAAVFYRLTFRPGRTSVCRAGPLPGQALCPVCTRFPGGVTFRRSFLPGPIRTLPVRTALCIRAPALRMIPGCRASLSF